MKKTNLIITLIITTIIFQSCEKGSVQNEKLGVNKQKIIEFSSRMGVVHNDGLNYLLKSLKTKFTQKAIYKNILEQEIRNNTAYYLKNIKEYLTLEQSVKNLSDPILNSLNISIFYSNKSTSLQSPDEEINYYNTKLRGIFDDSSIVVLEDYLKEITSLKQDAINSISDNQVLLQVLIPMDIAMNSLQYWYNNTGDWIKFLSENQSSKANFSWPWKDLALSDAEGAVVTAIGLAADGTGAALVAAGPGGWAAGGMVIAAGGLGSSGIAFFNWYLNL